MDSINTLAVELAKKSSQVRSTKIKFLCDFDQTDLLIFEKTLVGEYAMDVDNIKTNINTLISSHQFKNNLDEVSKAFIAIVDKVRNGDDNNFDDLGVFCQECLFRWPDLSSLPLILELNPLEFLFDFETFTKCCALSQLVIYCDKYKLEFFKTFKEIDVNDLDVIIAILNNMQEFNQLNTTELPKIMDVLFECIWEDIDVVMPFIKANIMHFNIDITRLVNYLQIESKQKEIITLAELMINNGQFSLLNTVLWVNKLLLNGSEHCILSAKVILNTLQLEQKVDVTDFVDQLIRLAPMHPDVVTGVISSFNIKKLEASFLSRLYPASFSLIGLLSKYKDEIDYYGYVARCFETGFIEETLNAMDSITIERLPLVLSYVGKYESANKMVLGLMECKQFSYYDYEFYTDRVIPRCIDGINVVLSLEIIDRWPVDKRFYATRLWPLLENADSSLARTSVMLSICELEEYQLKAYDFYLSWVPYLHEILHEKPHLLQNLPMRLLGSAILTLTENTDSMSLEQFLSYGKFLRFRRILADCIIDSKNFRKLWLLASLTPDFYVQKLAWQYCTDDYFYSHREMFSLMNQNRLEVPSDEIADSYLRSCFQNFDRCYYLKSFGKIAAFLYNNTGIPLHLSLMSKLTNSAFFFSSLIRNLSPQIDKQPLLPLLLNSLLTSDCDSVCVDTVKLIDSSEEADVFCESLLTGRGIKRDNILSWVYEGIL